MENENNELEKIDYKKKCEELSDQVRELNKYREPEPNEKICPFMSTPDKKVACNERCKLYRHGNKSFECYLMELRSISWNLRKN